MKKVLLMIVLLFGILLYPSNVFASDELTVEVTTKKGLYVRKNATTASSKKGGLIYNTEVSVYDNKYSGKGCSKGWYKISNGRYEDYYICSNYTKVINKIEDVDSGHFQEKVVSVTTGLNLRSEPNKKSKKLTTLAKGKNYVATERVVVENSGCKNDTWYKIQVNDKSGYVCSAYLRNGASTDDYVETCNNKITESKANSLGVKLDETFVEVNLTTQKLTFYKNGVCNIIASTVTGKSNPAKEAIDTIPGSFRITEKTRNKYFTSSDVYSNYWMRFNLGMGLHDADNWRSKYGYRASHGCVNLPLSATKIIYDNVEIGTRVIVHK